MDYISAIPIFVTVVQQGGFSPAARLLGLSKSAVSKRITQLENDLGAKLLHRTTRKLSLTEAGEQFYRHALIANNAAKEAEDAVTQLQGAPRGELRINVPMSFGRLHIAPLIPAFLLRYPDIKIEMTMQDSMVDLIAGGYDLAIRAGRLTDSTLVAKRLAPLKSVLCASPEYLEIHGNPKQLAELTSHNCLAFSHSQDVKSWQFHRGTEQIEIEVTGNYQVNNSEALEEALLQGLGIARLPTFVASKAIKQGRLVHLFPEYEMTEHGIYAVFAERRYMPAKVRAFIDFVIESIGEETTYWDNF